MSDAILGGTRAASLIERAATLLPGLGLLFAVGYAGKLTEQGITAWGKSYHVVLPNIEYVLWAILYGLAIWAFLLTFAGVGLSADLRKIQALGWRPLAVAAGGMAGIAVLTFALVWTADWSGWL